MARRISSPAFVGRAAELGELTDALRLAQEGEARAVLLGGESGVGKSRLVAEFSARAREAGAQVLAGDCVDLGDAELPYAPLVAALRALARDREPAELDRVLTGAREALAPLLPEVGPAAPTDGAPLAQSRLFEALLAVLSRVGDEAPLVLVVEDLHWADRSTREFLAFLVRNGGSASLLLIATYRSDELHRRHPLRPFLAEAERTAAVVRLDLARFTRDELAAQAAGILGQPAEPELVDELLARGEGNAFFTEELVAARVTAQRLPDSLRGALMLRVEALDPTAQQVLRVAAAAGPQVGHRLLAAAAALPEPELLEALREAVAHNVLVHDPATSAYAFRHALLREALDDDLLPGERAPLHARIAAALQDDASLSVSGGAVAAELAFHWSLAHDLPAALAAFLRAGREAERLSAFAEANAHYERALELLPSVPEPGVGEVELLRRAAAAAHFAGDHDRAAALARRVVALIDAVADPVAAALMHERLGRYSWVAGMAQPAAEALRTAVSLMPDNAPAADRARVLGAEGHILMLTLRSAEALERLRPALELAREDGAPLEVARILNSMGPALGYSGAVDEAIPVMEEGLRLAVEAGAIDEVLRAYVNLGETLDLAGRMDDAVRMALDGWRTAQRERMRSEAALLASEAVLRLLRLGRWDEAAAVLDEAVAEGVAGVTGAALVQADAELAALRGEPRATQRMAEAERLLGQPGSRMWTAPLSATSAALALWTGRPEDARALIERELALKSVDETDASGFVVPLLALGARAEADLAVAARALGDETAASDAVARAGRCQGHLAEYMGGAGPEVQAHAATCVAEVARAAGHDTPDHWAAVAAAWDGLPRPFQAACARWREAAAALDAGDGRPRAETPLRAAAATAREIGAAPLLAEVEALARRARIDLGPAAGGDGGAGDSPAVRVGLTPRELEVLRLVAAGHTNREIGAELFISEKTASVHLSRILTKLGARGRVEAAGLAHRLGLLDDAAA